jgi:hypothetical protein
MPVTLSGSTSDDEFNGQVVSSKWTQVSGETVTLSDDTILNPSFTAPANASELLFRLTSTDDTGLTASDDTTVLVESGSGLPILLVKKSGTGEGSVASSPTGIDCGTDCVEEYSENTDVTLTATAGEDSVFTTWSGSACTDSSTTCTVTMDETKTVEAVFTTTIIEDHTLSVSKSGSGEGSVNSDPTGIDCGTDCSEDYQAGTSVILSAVAAENSVFTQWSGACSGSSSCTVTMDAAKNVQAIFTTTLVEPKILTVQKIGSGKGSVSSTPAGIDCGSDCTENYTTSTSITLTATPEADSRFARWKGDCQGTTNTCTLTVENANKTVVAVFAKIRMKLLKIQTRGSGKGNVSSTPAGIDCGSDCTQNYKSGTLVTLTATPDENSIFVRWKGGSCKGSKQTCTVKMYKPRTTIAVFKSSLTQYRLRVGLPGSGDGQVTNDLKTIDCSFFKSKCSANFSDNTKVTLTAKPSDSSSKFIRWRGACRGTNPVCTITMDSKKYTRAVFRFVF